MGGDPIMSTVFSPDIFTIYQAKVVASGLAEGQPRLAGIDTPLPDVVAMLLFIFLLSIQNSTSGGII
jgi:hypothetical protein